MHFCIHSKQNKKYEQILLIVVSWSWTGTRFDHLAHVDLAKTSTKAGVRAKCKPSLPSQTVWRAVCLCVLKHLGDIFKLAPLVTDHLHVGGALGLGRRACMSGGQPNPTDCGRLGTWMMEELIIVG